MQDRGSVYYIKNKENCKCYVGATINVRDRIAQHKNSLRNNSHPNKYLQEDWNDYGEGEFIFREIDECEIFDLNNRERYWIEKINSIEKGYNLKLPSKTSHKCYGTSPETPFNQDKPIEVIKPLEKFMLDKKYWEGTATELKNALEEFVDDSKRLPGAASWLSNKIKDNYSQVKEAGLEVHKKRKPNKRLIEIVKA